MAPRGGRCQWPHWVLRQCADECRFAEGRVLRVPEKAWRLLEQEADGTQRQWAELDFAPGERGEKKQTQPLRYVGLRLLKPQGALFADGSDRHHHAVVTNLDSEGDRLLNWHREKAGTVEHVHDEIKNALAGGHVPSQLFGANAAWFKLTLMLYNIGSAIKGLCLVGEERLARWKKLRLLMIHSSGRLNRNACVLRLRFCASPQACPRKMGLKLFPNEGTSPYAWFWVHLSAGQAYHSNGIAGKVPDQKGATIQLW